jgi:hypothetical protein
MMTFMPTTVRPQQRYDHRLWHLVHCTGDVTVATDLGVPRSMARGWLGHNSLQSTEMYLRADPTQKLEAVNLATPMPLRQRAVHRSRPTHRPLED